MSLPADAISGAGSGSRPLALVLPELHAGGAQQVMLTLAQAFTDKGHAVDLVLARADGPLVARISSGITVVDLDVPAATKGSLSFATATVLRLAGYLRARQPRAVLSSITGMNLATILARSLSRSSCRLALREEAALQNVTARSRLWLMKRLYPKADAVIALNREMRLELERICSPTANLWVIPNAINPAEIRKLSEAALDHPWIADDAPFVVSAGRLCSPKDFGTLIAAFSQLKAPLKLVILGEGPSRTALEHQIHTLGLARRVLLAGYDPNPYRWMARARAFVLSSRWEGFGLVLAEALALGIPVVSTDCPNGPAEVLGQGRWGRLVEIGNVEAMRKAIEHACSTPADANALQARAAEFDASAIADRYLDILLN